MSKKITIEFTFDWEDSDDIEAELMIEDSGILDGMKEGVSYKIIDDERIKKEPTEEEIFQQWIKEHVTVLGENDFLVGHKRVHSKRDLSDVYNKFFRNGQK